MNKLLQRIIFSCLCVSQVMAAQRGLPILQAEVPGAIRGSQRALFLEQARQSTPLLVQGSTLRTSKALFSSSRAALKTRVTYDPDISLEDRYNIGRMLKELIRNNDISFMPLKPSNESTSEKTSLAFTFPLSFDTQEKMSINDLRKVGLSEEAIFRHLNDGSFKNLDHVEGYLTDSNTMSLHIALQTLINKINLQELNVISLKGTPHLPVNLQEFPDLCGLRIENYSSDDVTGPRHFPPFIGSFEKLEKLVLKRLGIKEVPATIGDLSNLKHLDLSENPISRLSKKIGHLPKLESLDLSNCHRLTGLPASFKDLELKLLNTSGTALPKPKQGYYRSNSSKNPFNPFKKIEDFFKNSSEDDKSKAWTVYFNL